MCSNKRRSPQGRKVSRSPLEVLQIIYCALHKLEHTMFSFKFIPVGLPKMRIEECASRQQARIDSGAQAIVGVNKYQAEKGGPGSESMDVRKIDNAAALQNQVDRLKVGLGSKLQGLGSKWGECGGSLEVGLGVEQCGSAIGLTMDCNLGILAPDGLLNMKVAASQEKALCTLNSLN